MNEKQKHKKVNQSFEIEMYIEDDDQIYSIR